MNGLKKFLAVIFITCLSLGLTSCGDDEVEPTNTTPNSKQFEKDNSKKK